MVALKSRKSYSSCSLESLPRDSIATSLSNHKSSILTLAYTCEVEVRQAGVWGRQLSKQILYEWVGIDLIEESADGVNILTRDGAGVIVRARAFASENERAQFVELARKCLEQSSASWKENKPVSQGAETSMVRRRCDVGTIERKNTSSTAVASFLDKLPPERRREVVRVRKVLRRHVPRGYEEVISKNMLVYQVPLEVYCDTYNKQPLWYVALASEKSYLSLHLVRVYGDPAQAQRLKEGFKAAGKKLDMGKACIHFKTADELELDVIGEIVASTLPERWVEITKAARAARHR